MNVVSKDITRILEGWPYEPGKISARRVPGDDGRDKIQLRLDLGLYQMESVGRPDGARPHGCESLLAYHEQRLIRHRAEVGSDVGFHLDGDECEQLRAEGMMYYHRYLAEFILEDFAAVERDTRRNLRLMDFCFRYAQETSDKFELEQYRPYVLTMCARARAFLALRQGRPKAALAAVREGIERVRGVLQRFAPDQAESESRDLAVLRAMAKEIEDRIPVDPVARLRRELAKAVREERYEDAASIRDQLRVVQSSPQVEEAGEGGTG